MANQRRLFVHGKGVNVQHRLFPVPDSSSTSNNGQLVHIEDEVNTFGQADDCYYRTLAALLSTTMEELILRTGIPHEGPASIDQIAWLYDEAGLPIRKIVKFDSTGGMSDWLDDKEIDSTLDQPMSIPVGWQVEEGLNHMVVLRVYREMNRSFNINGRLDDFQNPEENRTSFEFPNSALYYIFDTHGLDTRIPDAQIPRIPNHTEEDGHGDTHMPDASSDTEMPDIPDHDEL